MIPVKINKLQQLVEVESKGAAINIWLTTQASSADQLSRLLMMARVHKSGAWKMSGTRIIQLFVVFVYIQQRSWQGLMSNHLVDHSVAVRLDMFTGHTSIKYNSRPALIPSDFENKRLLSHPVRNSNLGFSDREAQNQVIVNVSRSIVRCKCT